jgi:hypothetical protein
MPVHVRRGQACLSAGTRARSATSAGPMSLGLGSASVSGPPPLPPGSVACEAGLVPPPRRGPGRQAADDFPAGLDKIHARCGQQDDPGPRRPCRGCRPGTRGAQAWHFAPHPSACLPHRGHSGHRPELRASTGLVPQHQGGWNLPPPPARRAARPRRAGAGARRAGRQGHALALPFRAQARGPYDRMCPAANPAYRGHPALVLIVLAARAGCLSCGGQITQLCADRARCGQASVVTPNGTARVTWPKLRAMAAAPNLGHWGRHGGASRARGRAEDLLPLVPVPRSTGRARSGRSGSGAATCGRLPVDSRRRAA